MRNSPTKHIWYMLEYNNRRDIIWRFMKSYFLEIDAYPWLPNGDIIEKIGDCAHLSTLPKEANKKKRWYDYILNGDDKIDKAQKLITNATNMAKIFLDIHEIPYNIFLQYDDLVKMLSRICTIRAFASEYCMPIYNTYPDLCLCEKIAYKCLIHVLSSNSINSKKIIEWIKNYQLS